MSTDSALVLAASLVFLLATGVYGAFLTRFRDRLVAVGTVLLALGAVLSVGAIVARASAGHMSVGVYDALLVCCTLVNLVWLFWQVRRPPPVVGAFLAPVMMMVMYSLHVFHREAGKELGQEVTLVTPLHIGASLVGFLIFAVAAVAAALQLVQEYRLKTKRLRMGQASRIPPIRTLERIAHVALIAGFPIFSAGVALGAVWFLRLETHIVSRHAVMATVSWTLYALLLHARVVVGLKGRKAALLTLAAFTMSLFVVLLSILRLGA